MKHAIRFIILFSLLMIFCTLPNESDSTKQDSIPSSDNNPVVPPPVDNPIVPDTLQFPRQLTNEGINWGHQWSPDGEYIAFDKILDIYEDSIIKELWIMRNDGLDKRLLFGTQGIKYVKSSFWVYNTSEMIVTFFEWPEYSVWRVNLDGEKTKLLDDFSHPDTGAPHSLEDPLPSPPYPKCSPDGQKIAFLTGAVWLSTKLVLADIDFKNQAIIDSMVQGFHWQKDSQGILYSTYDKSSFSSLDLFTFDITTGDKRCIFSTDEHEFAESYSSSGEYFLFRTETTLYISQSDSFQPRKLIDYGRYDSKPIWIPQKDLIVVHAGSKNIKIIDTNGNKIGTIENEPRFSPSGNFYTYLKGDNIWLNTFDY